MSLHRRPQRGVGLIELMVAMTLGLFLVAGIYTMYLGSKRTYRVTDADSRIQETARFVIDTLSHDVRMAGFWGCIGNVGQVFNRLKPDPGYIPFAQTAISGTDDTGLNGSDTLIVAGAYGDGQWVETPEMPTPSAALHTKHPNGFLQGDLIVVTDCIDADIFQITNANPGVSGTLDHGTGNSVSPGNAIKELSKVYRVGPSQVFKIDQYTYSIGPGASGEPVLFRNGQELGESVENLQVSYGIDADDNDSAERFVDADGVADWSQVVSVRISLLIRSSESVVDGAPMPYTYQGKDLTPGDGRIRRVFTTHIGLRNRLP